ncbi:ATP-binding protein [Alkalimarinus alittae]|uniref:ATP-binding protein n=1 Tax=Alkalimarinus alittae TaxID=2961619 RepID=A0ABY6MX93_9ALTE|nr:ATP-binding protein [Alkalimarinus alittae]UZE94446.1 ATP-binding protein [Alkalimarinus alittae]
MAKNPQLTLTLIRGLPGSGKSTLAKEIDAIHLETDQFFMWQNGAYQFNPKRLSEAHQWCQKMCSSHLEKGQSVAVSNTFIKRWEMEAYIKMAKQFNAELVTVVCNGNYKSIHDVPESTIAKMRKAWEP